jgi:signal transduction histidine kinase
VHSLQEILQNLLDNARRYAPGSSIDVRAARADAWVVLRVDDRGPGIPRDEHERVFERGYCSGARRDGSGLGLYVAARLLRDQGGHLRVEDRAGGGASFVLTLPAEAEGGVAT